MAHRISIFALCIAAALPASVVNAQAPSAGPSPADDAATRYCLRVEAPTGSRIEHVRCWTRAEWAWQGVDVDREWAEEGVSIIR